MNLPRAVVNAYGAEQARIMKAATSEILRVSGMLDWTGDYEELILNREAMTSVTADIVSRYGGAAAANAAELFEVMEEAFTGKYKAAVMDTELTYSTVNSMVHFAARSLFPEDGAPADVDAFLSRVTSAAVRMINQHAMDTMKANGGEGLMYSRVTNGEKVCPLCEELAERGYVWDAEDLFAPHDGCMCSLVPGFGETRRLPKPGSCTRT